MAKKILLSVASGLAVLLVLSLAMILLLSYQEFFGQAITWLLCACIAILMFFTVYLTLSRIIAAARKHKHDEEALNEKHIEKILRGESARRQHTAQNAAIRRQTQIISLSELSEQPPPKILAEDEKNIRKQAEYEAKKAAEENARRRKLEAIEEQNRAEAEARARKIADAQAAALRRAAEEADEQARQFALAEAEALRRASEEAQQRLAEEEAERQRIKREEEARAKAAESEAAQRKAQAIESARKQAEAIALARRRAAQNAARSQSFRAITADSLPAFNTQIIEKMAGATDPNLSLSSSGTAFGAAGHVKPPAPVSPMDAPGDNIWEKMQVRQSAAPILSSEIEALEKMLPSGMIPLPAEPMPSSFADTEVAIEGETNVIETETNGWVYSPAKLPNAWAAEENTHKIPGEMPKANTVSSGHPDKDTASATSHTASGVERRKEGEAAHRQPPSQTRSSYASRNIDHPIASERPSRPSSLDRTGHSAQDRKASARRDQATERQQRPSRPVEATAHNRAGTTSGPATDARGSVIERNRDRTGEETTNHGYSTVRDHSALNRQPSAGSASRSSSLTRPGTREETQRTGLPNTGAEPPRRPRGRPPKPKTEEELNAPKRPRGRPPKPKTEEELNAPKRPRGRPPKPKTEEELNAPKRPRGRPRKYPLPEENTPK